MRTFFGSRVPEAIASRSPVITPSAPSSLRPESRASVDIIAEASNMLKSWPPLPVKAFILCCSIHHCVNSSVSIVPPQSSSMCLKTSCARTPL